MTRRHIRILADTPREIVGRIKSRTSSAAYLTTIDKTTLRATCECPWGSHHRNARVGQKLCIHLTRLAENALRRARRAA